jgi:hydroxyethylthiazole kinase-like uncharacterized protein yjeF
MKVFDQETLKELWRPDSNGSKFAGGQVSIVGGSKLFHGAPLMSLKAASRVVDMVYFSSCDDDKNVAEIIKSNLSSFIWIDRNDLDIYIAKSDAVLIGPGMMRYAREDNHNGAVCDDAGMETRRLSLALFEKFPLKKWVVDGGSLQVITPDLIPKGSVITPNRNEFMMLFGKEFDSKNISSSQEVIEEMARKYQLVIAAKGVEGLVTDGSETFLIKGGNVGLIKGGTGDVMAGLTVALLAKNRPVLAAAAAIYVVKQAADELFAQRDLMYSSDDLANTVPTTYGRLLNS